MYKYFAWVDSQGYQRSQELLPREVIARMINSLGKNVECFYTIQDYDRDGTIIGGFPVLDIDNIDLGIALMQTEFIVNAIKFKYGIDCATWFSGSKGYHIYIPLYIKHTRWHEITKEFMNMNSFDCDHKIYRSRSMIRVPESINSKSGKHKTVVKQWVGNQTSTSFDNDIATIINELPEKRITTEIPILTEELLPCINKLWKSEDLPASGRNQLILILVRAFRNQGIEAAEVEDMFDNHPAWSNYPRREYVKVINSIYRSGKSRLGCKTGADSEILKQYCDPLCFLNEDLDLFELADVD